MNFRKVRNDQCVDEILPYENLKKAYLAICDAKNQLYKNNERFEVMKTSAELQLARLIKKQTKLHFMTSVWIGQRNIDIFFPQLLRRGLAIEVDGGIHNHEIKMKKDASKLQQLEELGIAVSVIRNEELNEVTPRQIILNIAKQKRQDSRGRRRSLRNVYLYTVLTNSKYIDIGKYFSSSGVQFMQTLKKSLKITHSKS